MYVKKYFKKLKLIHVLLIILILVIFFGLFKKEIKTWQNWVDFNIPTIENRTITESYECKKLIDTEKKELSSKYWRECRGVVREYREWLAVRGGISKEVFDECRVQEQEGRCCELATKAYVMPEKKEVEATCYADKQEKWLTAFGEYWFKIF